MLNRKLIGILSIWGAIQCSAQDISVCNALKEANTTLKQYTIGTDEFSPYDIKEHGDRFMFKKFELSIDYPNFVLSYIVGGRVSYPGWVSTIKEGTYKLEFPISSSIEYPVVTEYFGRKTTNAYQINIVNDDGLEKTANGKKSIITSFTLYGDEILTTKKLAAALISLRQNVLSSNFKGKLNSGGITKKRNTNNSNKVNNQQKRSKSGKYGQ